MYNLKYIFIEIMKTTDTFIIIDLLHFKIFKLLFSTIYK